MSIVRKSLSPADIGNSSDPIAIVKGLRWQLQHQRGFHVVEKKMAPGEIYEGMDQGQGSFVYLPAQRATDRRQRRAPESMATIFARLAGQGADLVQAEHCLDCPEPGKRQEHRAHISPISERTPTKRDGLPEGSYQGNVRSSRSSRSKKAHRTNHSEKETPYRSKADPIETGKRRA